MRLQRVVQTFGERVQLWWEPFALRPGYTPGAFRFAGSYVEAAWRRVAALCGDDGIAFRMWGEAEFPRSSMPGLEAGVAAQQQGEPGFAGFHVALFRAFFEENRNVNDPAVLLDVARSSGLDVGRFDADRHAETVRLATRDRFERAINDGFVTAVPTVVIGTRRIVGLVEAEAYRNAIAEQL